MVKKKNDAKPAKYRNRIKEVIQVKGSEVRASPFNWRKHPEMQRNALSAVLSEIGIAGVPVCYRGADGMLYAVDGHCRLHDVGAEETWTVAVLDITEEEAKKLITVYDPISELAEIDSNLLSDLLGDVSFEDPALSDFLSDLAESNSVILDPEGLEEHLNSFFEEAAPSDTSTEKEKICPHCGGIL